MPSRSYPYILMTLSKEQNLERARKHSEQARELNERITKLYTEVKNFVVPSSNRKSENTFDSLWNEVKTAMYCHSSMESTYRTREDDVKRQEEAKNRIEQEKERKKQAEAAVVKAIAFLIANGVKQEEIVTSDVFYQANELRFEQLVDEYKGDNTPIEFDGSDSCEDCPGWIPGNHRCECGNRRVNWSYSGDFTGMFIYPEAY